MSALPILIVGGSGKTGARVDARLRARGIATRPVSRTSAVRFDWTAPDTWPAALHGVSAAYVTYQPDLAVEGAVDAIGAFARLARDSGVERVVLLSGRGGPARRPPRPRCRRRAWGGAWCARAGSTRTSRGLPDRRRAGR